MNTITLGGQVIYDPPASGRLTNEFVCHSGASRHGVGRFLMLRKDYDAIDVSGAVMLVMTSPNIVSPSLLPHGADKQGISIPVLVALAAPYSTSVDVMTFNDRSANDFVEVYVFDWRCSLLTPKTNAVNAVKQSTYTGSDTSAQFYPSTLNTGSPYSWSGAMTKLEIDGINWPSLPSWNPRNLIFDDVPTRRVIDAVAEQLRLVVGYDPTKGKKNLLVGLTAYGPGNYSPANKALLDLAKASNWVSAGRYSDLNLNRLPGFFKVSFKLVNLDTPGDPYAQREYVKTVTNALGDASLLQQISVGEYVGIYQSGAVANQTELDAVANDIAARELAFMSSPIEELELIGIWPFSTDGAIRGIRWVSDNHGARTILRINNARDFYAMDETRRSLETLSNTAVVGLGSTEVQLGMGGMRFVAAPGGDNTISGKITSNTSVDGQYNGESYTPGTTTAASVGTLAGSEDCIVWNLAEAPDLSGWDVTAANNRGVFALGFVGKVVGIDAGTGKKIVHGTIYFASCS